MCIAITIAKTHKHLDVHIAGLIPRDFEMTFRTEKIKIINEALKHRIISLLNLNIFYIEQQNDWTDENNRLIMKYFYKDELHLEKLGNQKLNKTILEALKKRQYLLQSITNNSKINTISNNFLCNKEQFPLINKEVHHLAKQNSPDTNTNHTPRLLKT